MRIRSGAMAALLLLAVGCSKESAEPTTAQTPEPAPAAQPAQPAVSPAAATDVSVPDGVIVTSGPQAAASPNVTAADFVDRVALSIITVRPGPDSRSCFVELGFSNDSDAVLTVTGIEPATNTFIVDQDDFAVKTLSAPTDILIPARTKVKGTLVAACLPEKAKILRFLGHDYPIPEAAREATTTAPAQEVLLPPTGMSVGQVLPDEPPPPPAAPIFEATRKAIAADELTTLVSYAGGAQQPTIRYVADPVGYLVGFEIAYGPLSRDVPMIIRAIKPIIQTPDGPQTAAKEIGRSDSPFQTVIARPGYAVGGLKFKDKQWGWQVIFMRIVGPFLDPKDQYLSEWYGVQTGPTVETLATTGQPIVGVTGWAGYAIDTIALVQIGTEPSAGQLMRDVADPRKQHPAGAKSWNGHWYMLAKKEATWYDARAFCKEAGGYLVTINSAEELKAVAKLAGDNRIWLGGTDWYSEGSFRWVTGEPFDYTNWHPGEPNNEGGKHGENFLMMDPRRNDWNDLIGEDTLLFICEWEN